MQRQHSEGGHHRCRPVASGSRGALGHTPQYGRAAVGHLHSHRHRSLTEARSKTVGRFRAAHQQDSVYGGLRRGRARTEACGHGEHYGRKCGTRWDGRMG